MKVALSGGTGVISREIAAAAVTAELDVICLNRRGKAPVGSRAIRVDRHHYAAFSTVLRDLAPDVLVDMLAFGALDVDGVVRSVPAGAHYVLCSSVCVYGLGGDGTPMKESAQRRPVKPYGAGKAAAEDAAIRAAGSGELSVTIVRPSTVYGPGGLLPRQLGDDPHWYRRALTGVPTLVVDHGRARHQFLHACDAGRAFVGLMAAPPLEPAFFNLVGPTTTWARYHIDVAQALGGPPADLRSVTLRTLLELDPVLFDECDELAAHDVVFDGAAVRRRLPFWQPEVTLTEGVPKLVEILAAEGEGRPTADWEDFLLKITSA